MIPSINLAHIQCVANPFLSSLSSVKANSIVHVNAHAERRLFRSLLRQLGILGRLVSAVYQYQVIPVFL